MLESQAADGRCKFLLFMVSLASLSYMRLYRKMGDFPGGAVVRNLPADAGDTGLSPGPGRSHMPQSN